MNPLTKVFRALNPQQKLAVETIDGPLLVVAGPGTGKTQLLSTRVAHILQSTDTRPGNILCLTFTNKAAVNMKERIVSLAGPAGAKVNIKTFHSFAAEIMNIYPDYFWNAAQLSVAPDSIQLDIIESIVSKLPLDNPLSLKFAGQFTLLNDIQRAINLAKDAGLTPEKLKAIIKGNLAYIETIEQELVEITSPRLSVKTAGALAGKVAALPPMKLKSDTYPLISLSEVLSQSLQRALDQDEATGKTLNCGIWKKCWVQTVAGQKGMFAERRRNEWWLALADIYKDYRSALHQRGFYDYADMLVEVISQLEQTPEMLADVQERFSYVMIDEFQDTNPAQLRLSHLVADHESANGSPNLMVVGDDDQTIFKFNGAELNNMLGFKKTYPKTQIIVLTDNYRSSQKVLDTAQKIIAQAEVRLVNSDPSLDKNLLALNPPKDPGEIRAEIYSSRELQLSQVARQIKRHYSPQHHIAVLARGHDSLLRMTAILQKLAVPVRYEQQSNVLDHEIVRQAYLVMELLLAIQQGDEPKSNALIHQIIRHPAWGLSPKSLWKLAVSNFKNPAWLDSLLRNPDKTLSAIGEWFIFMAQQAQDQPVPVTVEQILGLRKTQNFTSPIRQYFTRPQPNDSATYFHGLSALQLLRSLVHEFAGGGNPNLADFARFIDVNQTNGRIIADESPFVTGKAAVQLLTVHKAKGLEFDEVYIIDCIEDNWQPRPATRKPPANLPLQPVGDDLDDFIRLLYVAVTRAKSAVYISAYSRDHAGKEVSASPLVLAAFDNIKKIDEESRSKLIEVLEENLHWPALSGGEESEILKARLEEYSLSVTHLLNFLDVTRGGPQYFKEKNLLRLPEAKTPSLSFGTSMHTALETAQKLVNKKQFELSKVTRAFNQALAAEQLPPDQYKRYKTKGHTLIQRLFNDFNLELPIGSLPEQKLRDVRLNKAVINGKLDRVDLGTNSLVIADYKTGRPLNNLHTKDKTLALKAYKHRLQLIFYALIARQHPSYDNLGAAECQMVYLEADTANGLVKSYRPSDQEIERLKLLIEVVWNKIQKLDLPQINNYPADISGVLAFEEDLLAGKI